MLIDRFITAIDPYIPRESIQRIFDVGSRDMCQAQELETCYQNAQITAFECHPGFLDECHQRAVGRISLVRKAVSDHNGTLTFNAFKRIGQNPGASSIFKPIRKILQTDHNEEGFDEVEVECTRLDSFEAPDLIWMDIQGAELLALRGLGNNLAKVKAIATEVETEKVYDNSVTFVELQKVMYDNGFVLIDFQQDWECEANVVYIRRELL
jgi:FkbM family methyltransferase